MFLKDLLIKKKLEGRYIFMLVVSIYNHTYKYIQWSCMLSTKPCARQIAKMYDLAGDACRFFNSLKVDMFLNPTNIEPTWATTDNSLLYTPEGEVLDEIHGIPRKNPSFILLSVGYPINCYWKKLRDAFCFYYVFMSLHMHFKNILILCTGLLQTVSTILQLYNVGVKKLPFGEVVGEINIWTLGGRYMVTSVKIFRFSGHFTCAVLVIFSKNCIILNCSVNGSVSSDVLME